MILPCIIPRTTTAASTSLPRRIFALKSSSFSLLLRQRHQCYSCQKSPRNLLVPQSSACRGQPPLFTNMDAFDRSFSSSAASSTSATSSSSTTTSSSSSVVDAFDTTDEHAMLRTILRQFVSKQVEPQAIEYNKHEKFNLDLFRELGDTLGILGLTVDETYTGGAGMDATAVALVHEELSYSDPAFCLSYLAHSLLLVNNLHVNSTSDSQKQRFLPDLCNGVKIGGMGMSEPQAGTDVLNMQTKAVYDQDARGYILNGTKMWITNGTIDGGVSTGDVFLVYARTGKNPKDITQFIVEKDMEGFHLGQQIRDKLGMRASPTAELVFDNVFVPVDNVVGEVNQATLCMMRNLEIERVGLASMALGIARRCLDDMKDYALDRRAFNQDLMSFGQVQQAIATSYANYMAGRCYVYQVARALDLTKAGQGLDADGTKLYCASMAKTVADSAIQVMGGYGYVGEYNVERMWRDSKLLEIGGGTNESHHKNICRDLRKMQKNKLP